MQTSIKIIDNKKISLTQPEWELYNSICRSYDRANFKGEELFKDLFESDQDGIIIFLKPPTSKYTSMEVFLYVTSIMVHQHIRNMNKSAQMMLTNLQSQINETLKKIPK